jgi:hypothetical protein
MATYPALERAAGRVAGFFSSGGSENEISEVVCANRRCHDRFVVAQQGLSIPISVRRLLDGVWCQKTKGMSFHRVFAL